MSILQAFQVESGSFLVPVLGVGLLIFAFIINITSNKLIGTFTSIMSVVKVIGITIFAVAGLMVSGFSLGSIGLDMPASSQAGNEYVAIVASVALTILAFKDFTTITNSGSEIVNPYRNVGRAIIISILICTVIYGLVAWAVASNLSVDEIRQARDFALAEAARPAFGNYGVWFTVGIAIIATVSAIIANIFAVSRMLAMLTNMRLIPHKHFGMPGSIQKHMLVYTVVIGIVLTLLFDLSRIASIGAILCLVMDIIFHWGVLRRLHKRIRTKPYVIFTAIILDTVVLTAFVWTKAVTDMLIVIVSFVMIVLIFVGEKFFLQFSQPDKNHHSTI